MHEPNGLPCRCRAVCHRRRHPLVLQETEPMRTLTALCFSLTIIAAVYVADRVIDKGLKITFLHIIATPGEVRK